jgi:GDPmannose 4,6-dehydratase
MPLPRDVPSRNGRRAVITGITGQDGYYLAEFLLSKGYEVWGLTRTPAAAMNDGLSELRRIYSAHEPRLQFIFADLQDGPSLRTALKETWPNEVYHLGSQSHVHLSFQLPEQTGDVTGLGTVRLLEAIRSLELPARFFNASSAEVFGNARESPQRETTPIQPVNPYGAAKAYALQMTRIYREAHGMFAASGICFNHESPRRDASFVTRKITLAAARIAAGRPEPLRLGRLDSRRDWGYAGDFVRGMWLTLQAEHPDDYVIATGQRSSVREFCELAFRRVGLPVTWSGSGIDEVGRDPNGRVVISIDPAYFRPVENDSKVGDPSYAKERLGWEPGTSLAELVTMMVDYDVHCLRQEPRSGNAE